MALELGNFALKESSSKVFPSLGILKVEEYGALFCILHMLTCFHFDMCQENVNNLEKVKNISVSVVSSISEVSASDWDECCHDASGSKQFNPFITHGFLSSLEESCSAVKVSSI